MLHRRYSYDCDQTCINDSNFCIKYSIRSLYVIKQINKTKLEKGLLNLIFANFSILKVESINNVFDYTVDFVIG